MKLSRVPDGGLLRGPSTSPLKTAASPTCSKPRTGSEARVLDGGLLRGLSTRAKAGAATNKNRRYRYYGRVETFAVNLRILKVVEVLDEVVTSPRSHPSPS